MEHALDGFNILVLQAVTQTVATTCAGAISPNTFMSVIIQKVSFIVSTVASKERAGGCSSSVR